MDNDYLADALHGLIDPIPYREANLANASALLYAAMEDLNWVGFYMMEDGALVLGPFQGKPARVVIAVGNGVCGTAVQERRTVVVPDVHKFPGHIACDCASNAEIVVPLWKNGEILGVLDMDSPVFGRFTEEDRAGLERFAAILAEKL